MFSAIGVCGGGGLEGNSGTLGSSSLLLPGQGASCCGPPQTPTMMCCLAQSDGANQSWAGTPQTVSQLSLPKLGVSGIGCSNGELDDAELCAYIDWSSLPTRYTFIQKEKQGLVLKIFLNAYSVSDDADKPAEAPVLMDLKFLDKVTLVKCLARCLAQKHTHVCVGRVPFREGRETERCHQRPPGHVTRLEGHLYVSEPGK